MATGIIGKVLHNPVKNLKKESSTSFGALYMDAINRLFELDSEFGYLEEGEDDAIYENRK